MYRVLTEQNLITANSAMNNTASIIESRRNIDLYCACILWWFAQLLCQHWRERRYHVTA